jgi:predicted DNA-binding transcriptional regulator YafY
LAAELKVSPRTIHRYIGMLEEMGIPVCSERGPYGGFSLVRGYKLPPLLFSAEEATVLTMGARLVGKLWGQTYQEAVTSATAKLTNVLPDELHQEVARAGQAMVIGDLARVDYAPFQGTIDILRRCVIERRPVTLSYRGYEHALTERIVDPYGLFFRWGLWYIVGYCHLRQALRTFRVDRVQQAGGRDGHFVPPADFSLDDYVQETMQWEPLFTVEVEVSPITATRIREDGVNWMEMEEQLDGMVRVRFGSSELSWPTHWVLSLGASARVLGPPELVERVQQAAADVLALYRPPENHGS